MNDEFKAELRAVSKVAQNCALAQLNWLITKHDLKTSYEVSGLIHSVLMGDIDLDDEAKEDE